MNKKKQTEMDLKKGVEKASPWDPKVINFIMFSKHQDSPMLREAY